MGGRRGKRRHLSIGQRKGIMQSPKGVRSAYFKIGEEKNPLIDTSKENGAKSRTEFWERRVREMNQQFRSFFKFTEKEFKNFETRYDLHRESVHDFQNIIFEGIHSPYLENCRSLLDVGCGSGELMRRIVRTQTRLRALEEGTHKMRMLGVDFNGVALSVAALKRDILFEHHPELKSSLNMEFLMMDLIDMPLLDLSRTNISEEKVDAILASDIFRWTLRNERPNLLKALRAKIKETGHLICMEFAFPHLPPGDYLSAELSYKLLKFPTFEPMPTIMEFFKLVEDVGFSISKKSIDTTYVSTQEQFPPMISAMFRPRMDRKDAVVLVYGNDRDYDSGFGAHTTHDLQGDNFTLWSRMPINEAIDCKHLIIVGLADIATDFVLSDDIDSIKLHDKKAAEFLDTRRADLEKKGVKIIIGAVKQTESEKTAGMNENMRGRFDKLILEIVERWK